MPLKLKGCKRKRVISRYSIPGVLPYLGYDLPTESKSRYYSNNSILKRVSYGMTPQLCRVVIILHVIHATMLTKEETKKTHIQNISYIIQYAV